jgi:hypothetical protein
MSTAVVQLLHADPDLGEHMPPQAREQATELVRARVFRVPKGPWHPPTSTTERPACSCSTA